MIRERAMKLIASDSEKVSRRYEEAFENIDFHMHCANAAGTVTKNISPSMRNLIKQITVV